MSNGFGNNPKGCAVLPCADAKPAAKPKKKEKVDPIITPAKFTVVVRKFFKDAGGTRKPYTTPKRQPIVLKTSAAFDGTGTFACLPNDKIKFFKSADKDDQIKLDGKGNVFKGAELTSGMTLYAEGSAASTALDDVKLSLQLAGGSKDKGPDAKAVATSVEVTLDICKARPAATVNPPKVDAKDKFKPGGAATYQTGKLARTMLIVERPKPSKFNGTLVLEALDDKVKIFGTEMPVDKESPLTVPREIVASKMTGPVSVWVQGAKASGDIADTGFRLGIKELGETACDRVGVTVVPAIAAENQTDAPPTIMAVKNLVTEAAKTNVLKLSVAPKGISGKFAWSTSSRLFKLTNDATITVTLTSDKTPSASPKAEEISLTFTPTGKTAFPIVTHKLGVADVIFSKEATHDWGYDPYEEISCMDNNSNSKKVKPEPKRDIISIKKSATGKVKAEIKGAKPADVFYKSKKDMIAKPKVKQPSSASEVLQIEGGAVEKDETVLEAHLGSESGPVVAELGVVVLKQLDYKAEFFRVKDSTSAGTALKKTPKAADLQKECNKYYKPAVVDWQITGGASELDVPYDIIKNGALDLEPGVTTDEQKKIMDKCKSSKLRVVYIHDLHWSYYLASDAKAADKKIKVKNYGTTYLGYIGNQSYDIEDKKGNKTSVTVTAVNTATGELTLSAAIGTDFKTGDKAALIWPLGGLSGDPLWVKDVGDIPNYVAHELGHTDSLSNLKDIGEVDNIMYGGPTTGTKLRHRPLPKYYEPGSNEEQWKKMKGR
jgi:hypothetical protein